MNNYFEQKIYFNNKPIVLTNSALEYLKNNPLAAGFLCLQGAFERNIRLSKKHLKIFTSLGVIIEDIDPEGIKELLSDYFEFITAAGGVVSSPSGKTLMIFRRGKWDLPKGKMDEGETVEECAVREVIEETGLPDEIVLGKYLCTTYHIYPYGERDALKDTHWFQMSVNKEWDLHPQEEENIIEAKWIEKGQMEPYLLKSWDALREVLSLAGKI